MPAEDTSTYKKYARDTILAGIANLVRPLRGLILLPILSKTLGVEGYGTWSQIQVTINLLMPLALLQLGFTMTRFLAAERDKGKISKGFFSILAAASLTSFLFSVLMFVFARPLAVAFFGGADAEPFIKLAAFLVLLATIDQVVIEYFVAFRQMKRYSAFIIAQTIGEVALIAYLVSAGFGLYGAITALLAVRAALFIIGFPLVKRQIKFAIPNLATLKPYLAFSLPLLPYSLCYWMVNVGDRYVIGYFLGATAVGLYSAPYALGALPYLFYSPLVTVLFPAITYLYENNRLQELKVHLGYSLKLFLVFAIPAAFGLSVLSKSLLTTLTTSEFAEGYLIVPIVALGVLLFSCSYIFSDVLTLFKETKLVAFIFGGSALVNLVMNIILVPLIGILGAAISTLLTFTIHLIVVSVLANRRLAFDIDLKFIAKSIVSSVIMGAVVWKLNPAGAINILISVAVGAVVYFAVLTLLRGFSKNEWAFLKSLRRK